jgi:hypothetical protein
MRKTTDFMKTIEATVLLVLLCTSAGAQTTWGGLRFGMTEAQARAGLKTRVVKDVHKDPDAQPADQDSSVYAGFQVTSVAVNDFKGSATLLFSTTNKRLEQVNVNLEVKGTEAYIKLAGMSLVRELSQKYGKPVVDFSCDDLMMCEGTWRSSGQAIQLMIIAGHSVLISYVPANRSKSL